MIFNKQLLRHDPDNNVWGDCYRTVLACFLDRQPEDVPHFYGTNGATDEASLLFNEWLAKQGYAEFRTYFEPTTADPNDYKFILNSVGENNPNVYYMLSGFSHTGCNHVVICYNKEIVFDPSLTNSGIVGPTDNGYYMITVLTLKSEGQAHDRHSRIHNENNQSIAT